MTHSPLTTSIRLSYYNGQSRRGRRPERLILHHIAGFFTWGVNFMANKNDRDSCSNYAIGDNQLVCLIDEDFCPSSTGTSNDLNSITVEVGNTVIGGDYPVAPESVEMIAQLLADLSRRYGWGKIVKGVNFVWDSMFRSTYCPGDFLRARIDDIVNRANQLLNGGTAVAGLTNHPGYWLRDDAAAAFNAAERDHGVFEVNDAGRTVQEQQNLINRWNAGGPSNRPPYLFQPASPPEASNHVRGGGLAVDIGDWQRFRNIAASYGFQWIGSHDPVHFDFVGGGSVPSGGGGSTPISQGDDEEMLSSEAQDWLTRTVRDQINANNRDFTIPELRKTLESFRQDAVGRQDQKIIPVINDIRSKVDKGFPEATDAAKNAGRRDARNVRLFGQDFGPAIIAVDWHTGTVETFDSLDDLNFAVEVQAVSAAGINGAIVAEPRPILSKAKWARLLKLANQRKARTQETPAQQAARLGIK